MIENIIDFLRGIKNRVKNIYLNIKSILYWISIIKNDRWYDYTFLDILVQYKLKQMEDGFRNKSDMYDSEIIVNQLSDTIKDLDILINNSHNNNNELRKKVYSFIGEKSNTWWD
jgi:hypothetical protein